MSPPTTSAPPTPPDSSAKVPRTSRFRSTRTLRLVYAILTVASFAVIVSLAIVCLKIPLTSEYISKPDGTVTVVTPGHTLSAGGNGTTRDVGRGPEFNANTLFPDFYPPAERNPLHVTMVRPAAIAEIRAKVLYILLSVLFFVIGVAGLVTTRRPKVAPNAVSPPLNGVETVLAPSPPAGDAQTLETPTNVLQISFPPLVLASPENLGQTTQAISGWHRTIVQAIRKAEDTYISEKKKLTQEREQLRRALQYYSERLSKITSETAIDGMTSAQLFESLCRLVEDQIKQTDNLLGEITALCKVLHDLAAEGTMAPPSKDTIKAEGLAAWHTFTKTIAMDFVKRGEEIGRLSGRITQLERQCGEQMISIGAVSRYILGANPLETDPVPELDQITAAQITALQRMGYRISTVPLMNEVHLCLYGLQIFYANFQTAFACLNDAQRERLPPGVNALMEIDLYNTVKDDLSAVQTLGLEDTDQLDVANTNALRSKLAQFFNKKRYVCCQILAADAYLSDFLACSSGAADYHDIIGSFSSATRILRHLLRLIDVIPHEVTLFLSAYDPELHNAANAPLFIVSDAEYAKTVQAKAKSHMQSQNWVAEIQSWGFTSHNPDFLSCKTEVVLYTEGLLRDLPEVSADSSA